MVVVYIDGVDGTGKTTLINQLIRCHPADVTITAPPLWTYLPAVPVPAAFSTWVTTTPAATVAADLLAAQRTRVADLRSGSGHRGARGRPPRRGGVHQRREARQPQAGQLRQTDR
ncbi:hypothetical protein [Dactylosporangium sp. NPDC049140]|uniref:hypothetical protein n=1 Tax=Dactylosporangium sp. NPDC049140 TaxID=3155647 RepID=UPI0033E4ACDD